MYAHTQWKLSQVIQRAWEGREMVFYPSDILTSTPGAGAILCLLLGKWARGEIQFINTVNLTHGRGQRGRPEARL